MNPKCYKSAILIAATAKIFAVLVGYSTGGTMLDVAEDEKWKAGLPLDLRTTLFNSPI